MRCANCGSGVYLGYVCATCGLIGGQAPKKPWYKRTSTIVITACILAFVFLSVVGIVGYLQDRDSRRTTALSHNVQKTMQEYYAEHPDTASLELTDSLKLVHKQNSLYQGVVHATNNGQALTLTVTVVCSGQCYWWQASPSNVQQE